MELFILKVLILAASSTVVLGCDVTTAMTECMGHFAKIGTLAAEVQNDNSKMNEFCGYVSKFSECTKKYLSDCPEDQMKGLESSLAQLDQYSAKCGKGSNSANRVGSVSLLASVMSIYAAKLVM